MGQRPTTCAFVLGKHDGAEMDKHEISTTLELMLIELEYAANDLRFAQEEQNAQHSPEALKTACAEITAACRALEVASQLLNQNIQVLPVTLAS